MACGTGGLPEGADLPGGGGTITDPTEGGWSGEHRLVQGCPRTSKDAPGCFGQPGARPGCAAPPHFSWLSGQQFGQGNSSPVSGQVYPSSAACSLSLSGQHF